MLNNMAARSGRWMLSALAGVAFLIAAGTSGSAQQGGGGAKLTVVELRPNFYMIAGAGHLQRERASRELRKNNMR